MKLKISNSPTQNELEEIDLSSTTRRGAEYLIGRSPDSDLVLDSEDVSRHHGKFFFHSGNYYFSDLGSRNGTIINGKLADKNHSYILKNGDILRIGDFALMMEEDVSFSEQSETVVRIIQPEMFAPRSNQNVSVPDVATPLPELVNRSQESQPVNQIPIIEENNQQEFVNTSEDLTFVQSDEILSKNAEIAIPNNAVELYKDSEIPDVNTNDIDSDTSSVESEYTVVQSRDLQEEEDALETISQEDDSDSNLEEDDALEAISQEEDSDSNLEEDDALEAISQEEDSDSNLEEAPEAQSEIVEAVNNEELELELDTHTEIEELVSQTDSIPALKEEDTTADIPEEESFIELAPILEDKQIILIAHETKKTQLAELVAEHEEFLSYCLTRTWQTFSDYLSRETGLSVTQEIPPATSGGYQAINSLINSKEIIAVIFLRDFIAPQPGQASEEALLRTCNINEILLATNLPTAQAVIHYLKNMKD
ncbi:FHA domain-containing protein [Plectonema cf. radiosum LEGE 06105]|uniref:FHA domain-containing protein n=1 Tax=Plectonema cf. radiosum LEGE 06105 TaxID=945769 RepID=A0A8J7F8A5_9CYAN|nr:FHA domain-containing protein [Plectonema radiosum]MBE9216065.1 FHA domain-containing protein [Plectonema cf. radiosum LEGE 06105]